MSKNTRTLVAQDAIQAELAKLRAENERLKAKVEARSPLRLKVSEKGAVSLYGLGRFPVTLYAEQWPRVLAYADEITRFIEVHRGELKSKSDPVPTGPVIHGVEVPDEAIRGAAA